MDLTITIKAYTIPSAGAITSQEFKNSVYRKSTVLKVCNKGNSCLWYSLILLFYQNSKLYEKLKDTRGKLIDTMARNMCKAVGFDYNNKVLFDNIPIIIKD